MTENEAVTLKKGDCIVRIGTLHSSAYKLNYVYKLKLAPIELRGQTNNILETEMDSRGSMNNGWAPEFFRAATLEETLTYTLVGSPFESIDYFAAAVQQIKEEIGL